MLPRIVRGLGNPVAPTARYHSHASVPTDQAAPVSVSSRSIAVSRYDGWTPSTGLPAHVLSKVPSLHTPPIRSFSPRPMPDFLFSIYARFSFWNLETALITELRRYEMKDAESFFRSVTSYGPPRGPFTENHYETSASSAYGASSGCNA